MHWLAPARWRGRCASSFRLPNYASIRRAATLSVALSLACSVAAADTIVYGPQTYTRGTGQPLTVTNTFRVASASGTYTLRVTNHGVTSAAISLNGQSVLAPGDFTG